MPKFNVVLRHNPSGKAASAARGRKIRTMGPYNSQAAAKADAKALKTKRGVAVLVEPAAARKRIAKKAAPKRKKASTKPRSSRSMTRSLVSRAAKWRKRSTRRTGPSRGLSVGAVSNPRKRGARGSRSTSATAPAYLKFDGKRYTRYRKTWYTRKAEAVARAKKLRKAGNVYARIDHQASGYMVYVRKKPAALRNPAPKKKAKASSGKVKPKSTKVKAVGRIRRAPAGGPSRGLRAGILTNPIQLRWEWVGPDTMTAWDGRIWIKEDARGYVLYHEGRWNRVRVGRFSTLADAQREGQRHYEREIAVKRNPSPRRAVSRHAGPSTHVHAHRRHHAVGGVRGNPSDGWTRGHAGAYQHDSGHYVIKKERVRSRGRMVQKWALYSYRRGPYAGGLGSMSQFGDRWVVMAHYPTLRDAKAAVSARPRW
jgi:hypothetical protein